MKVQNPRLYNCKDEELPILGGFMIASMTRDLSDFSVYSTEFNMNYITTYGSRITAASEVIHPKSEILKQKEITARITETLTILIDAANRLAGYIKLANDELKLTQKDFGITQLKKSIYKKDIEGVIQSLKFVNDNIALNKEKLAAKGLNDESMAVFSQAVNTLTDDKRRQVEIISNRKGIILNNISLFNGLYSQLCDMMTVGKILYRTTNTAKLQDYTFSDLKKRVRRIINPKPSVTAETPQV